MTVKTMNGMFHVVGGNDTKKMSVACDFDQKEENVCGLNDRKEVKDGLRRGKRGTCKEACVVVSITENTESDLQINL